MGFPKGASIPFGRERGSTPARDVKLIRRLQPNSISKLAALAHRDFKRVYEDVISLSEAGLIDLTTDNARKSALRVADDLRLEIVV